MKVLSEDKTSSLASITSTEIQLVIIFRFVLVFVHFLSQSDVVARKMPVWDPCLRTPLKRVSISCALKFISCPQEIISLFKNRYLM